MVRLCCVCVWLGIIADWLVGPVIPGGTILELLKTVTVPQPQQRPRGRPPGRTDSPVRSYRMRLKCHLTISTVRFQVDASQASSTSKPLLQ